MHIAYTFNTLQVRAHEARKNKRKYTIKNKTDRLIAQRSDDLGENASQVAAVHIVIMY